MGFADYDTALVTMMTRTGIHLPETLRFRASEDTYSEYETPEGETVFLAHSTGKRLVEFADLDLDTVFRGWRADTGYGFIRTWEFTDLLRGMVIDPDEVDEVKFCNDCSEPTADEDDLYWTGHEYEVCESCYSHYWCCTDCDESWDETTTTLEDTEVCERCRARNWSHCEECEGWYRDQNSYEHEHDDDERCDQECESPAQRFTIRNDGEEPLANDTRVTVTLPGGVITPEGIGQIAAYLRQHSYDLDDDVEDGQANMRMLSYRLDELGDKWQTREGNFTKRLSRFAYKEYGLKVAPEVVSRVGCIARDHSKAVDFRVEVTRDLNLPREEFAHDGSCWWTDYYESRCALKTNGGFGLRTFTEYSWGASVSGRAWVMPLRKSAGYMGAVTLVPTFDTETPDAFVVFNGYGDLENYAPARVMSHMVGMTYRKISFSCTPMYVNNSSGYLVAPEEIASTYTDGSLHLNVEQHSDLFHTESYNESAVLTDA